MSDCDIVIHAGDIGNAAVLLALEGTRTRVFAVAGNNDSVNSWPVADFGVLSKLAEIHHIHLPLGIISVEHGHRVRDTRRYHEELRRRHPDSAIVVYGHTHIRVVDDSQVPWVINPGASGRERTKGGSSCLVIEAEATNATVFEHVVPPQKNRMTA